MLVFERSPKIAVVGDVMLDKYYEGDTERVSPEAPVPVVKVKNTRYVPGGAANVAANISALEAQVSVSGICGQDEDGAILREEIERCKINSRLFQVDRVKTISKNRVISRHQQLLRLDYEAEFPAKAIDEFTSEVTSFPEDLDALVLSDYAKGSLTNANEIILGARRRSIPVIVDPKGKDIYKYSHATIVTPNMKEFIEFVGECANEGEVITKAQQLIENTGIQALLVTRSEKGMTLFQREESPVYFAAEAQEVFDVTGAGDTVVAALATCVASGMSVSRAAYIANVAAGLVVKKMGTSSVSLSEVNRALKGLSTVESGVVSLQEAKQKVASSKQRSERVVFTNGCFDLLHPGHVSYLKQAKEKGDRLIVAVNSDESVKRLKGESRPINSLNNRMEVLAGLSSVDWVIPFDEDTPEKVIEYLSPDILVKGGDYEIDEIVGADFVKQNGGEVYSLHFENGCSTTEIIRSIREDM